MWTLVNNDVVEWANNYTGPPFAAMLCDPPYHLTNGFMGKKWDKDGPDAIAFRPETWAALTKHLLPGGFGMAFASSRGWHRLACAIEDAGLRLHPSVFCWITSQSFPKATRIDSKIDENAGISIRRGAPHPAFAPHGVGYRQDEFASNGHQEGQQHTATTEAAKIWAGHRYGGQILKNAVEPVIVFQKPYAGKPLDSITKTGAGALNIELGRIGTNDNTERTAGLSALGQRSGWNSHTNRIMKTGGARVEYQSNGREGEASAQQRYTDKGGTNFAATPGPRGGSSFGRWPSNFVLVHSDRCEYIGTKKVKGITGGGKKAGGQYGEIYGYESKYDVGAEGYHADAEGMETVTEWKCVEECPVRRLGEQSGTTGQLVRDGYSRKGPKFNGTYNGGKPGVDANPESEVDYNDSGTASRFYFNGDWNLETEERLALADPIRYCPKSSRSERDAGLDELPLVETRRYGKREQGPLPQQTPQNTTPQRNIHPTVKPLSLLVWLCQLLAPPQEYTPRRILIPFCGSGSEMISAMLSGFEQIVGIEQDAEYIAIAQERLKYWEARMKETGLTDPQTILKTKKSAKSQNQPSLL